MRLVHSWRAPTKALTSLGVVVSLLLCSFRVLLSQKSPVDLMADGSVGILIVIELESIRRNKRVIDEVVPHIASWFIKLIQSSKILVKWLLRRWIRDWCNSWITSFVVAIRAPWGWTQHSLQAVYVLLVKWSPTDCWDLEMMLYHCWALAKVNLGLWLNRVRKCHHRGSLASQLQERGVTHLRRSLAYLRPGNLGNLANIWLLRQELLDTWSIRGPIGVVILEIGLVGAFKVWIVCLIC